MSPITSSSLQTFLLQSWRRYWNQEVNVVALHCMFFFEVSEQVILISVIRI